MENTLLANFAGFTLITLLFLVGGGILIAHNRTIGQRARTAFLASCTALFFIAFVDWFNFSFSEALPHFGPFQSVSTMLTFAIAPFIPVAISQTIFPEKHAKIIFAFMALHALFEFASLFGGFVFWVDASNIYHRGPLYVIYMVAYIVSAAYLSVESIRAGRTYQSTSTASILAILSVMFSGVAVQVFDGTIRTTWPAVSMAVILYFQYYTDMVLRTDALTKLLNRHSYDDFIKHPTLPCVVILVDVDNFKNVNDSFGHAYGDVCLATVAHLIRQSYGGSGLCFRTGGDEFTIMLTKHQSELEGMNSTLEQLIAQEQARDSRIPGLSIGYAIADRACTSLEDVVTEADEMMYQNKRARKAGR